MKEYKIHPKTSIGHIHLTVSDLEKSLRFYSEILGFEVTQKMHGAVFLSAGGYHHHIGLNTWSGTNAQKPQDGQIGLYHFAILCPNRKELAKILKRLMESGYQIDGASDHGVSESIYLRDPDGNGIELYADRQKGRWPKEKNGSIQMKIEQLDIESLLKLAK